MKNYDLQVKEIPIIFRGIVGGLTPGTTPEPIIDTTLNGAMSSTGGYHSNLPGVLEAKEYISVEYNGIRFDKVPRYIYMGRACYGASFVGTPDQIRINFSVYPFLITRTSDTEIDIFTILENTTIKIWIEGETPQSPSKMTFSADLTGNGQINHFRARFACGENGTLHLRPYVILNGNVRVDLCNFAQGGDQYIAGDNEEIEFDCYVPVETHAVAYVEAENTGEYPSLVDAAMTVQYEDFIESESIVGYEGVNLRRGRR